MNSYDYEQLLIEEASGDFLAVYPHRKPRAILLQDGEGFHVGKMVKKYLKKAPFDHISDFPAHSPDLNWQENVWEMMDEEVSKHHPTTIEGLKRAMTEGWDEIPWGKI